MKMTLDLPDDLAKRVKLLAVHEDQKLKDTIADLLRKGLSAAAPGPPTVVKADKAMLKRRSQITRKFVTGEWGLELKGYEEARKAERLKELKRANLWRD